MLKDYGKEKDQREQNNVNDFSEAYCALLGQLISVSCGRGLTRHYSAEISGRRL